MYQSIQLNLTDSQYKNLSKGKSVNVSKASIGQGHTVFLTQRQINKIQKNSGLGKGTRVSLSQHQLEYNLLHGSGFRDFVKGAWGKVKDVGKSLVNQFGDQAVSAASNMANNLLNNGTLVASAMGPKNSVLNGIFQDTLKMGNSAAQDQILAILKGLKASAGGSYFSLTPVAQKQLSTMEGQGFFDDVLDVVSTPIKAIASVAAPVVSTVSQQALANLMNKALTGKGTRGRPKKVGLGVLPPGVRASGRGLLNPGQHIATTS